MYRLSGDSTLNNSPQTCDPERIELFIQQQLSDEEQATFELHLDDCDDCCHRLEVAAARDDIWSGVRDSLLGQQLTSDCMRSGDSALDSETGSDALFSHGTVLKLLAPTDDDRMIGRLGTYEVAGVIGSGGMGVVLKAFDAALNRYVAIKVLAPHLGSSGAARKRFACEAQAAAAVVHDNVIEIHGVADAHGPPISSCFMCAGRLYSADSITKAPSRSLRFCESECKPQPGWLLPTPKGSFTAT